MLGTTLSFLADEVNAHLVKCTGTALGAVSVGALCDDRGLWVQAMDTTRLTLFQIEEDSAAHHQLPPMLTATGAREGSPPLQLNAVLLFAVRFQQYEQALGTLSLILGFFHARPVFTQASSPALPDGLEKVVIELLSYGPEQMSQMWSCLGAKHLPSLVYRLRMVVRQEQQRTTVPARNS